jgi:flagellar basal-body rod protein FlgG
MEAQQMQLDVISNNLANVSTTGFKRAHAVFEDLMYQNLRQVGANSTEQSQLPTGLQVGLGVRTVATSRSFAQGNLQQTSNKLDVAIQGNGFFQVTMPDGTTGYTRDGSFQVDNQGRWSPPTACRSPTASRFPPMPRASPSRRRHGHRVIPGSTAPQASAPSRWPASSTRPAWSRRARTCSPKAPHRASRNRHPGRQRTGGLMQGFVETSNVNVVQELVT